MEKAKTRRATVACLNCRQSKVKCSGLYPCNNCQKRSLECLSADSGRNVIVSERYLRYLQAQTKVAEASVAQPSLQQTDGGDTGVIAEPTIGQTAYPTSSDFQQVDASHDGVDTPLAARTGSSHETEELLTSPFTLPSMTMRNQQRTPRGWVYLGPSSAASYSARLTIMMSRELRPNVPFEVPIQLDGDVYELDSTMSVELQSSSLKDIPAADFSIYLFNVVKFHLGRQFGLLDEPQFTQNLREFYQDAAEKVTQSGLWFMQFMLVLAFGKSLVPQSQSGKGTSPPGANFFQRAMAILPNCTQLWKDPFLAIEVLVLISLYLYSIDKKESAYLYIGHAIRMCSMEGLHTELPQEEIGYEAWKRGYDLWWTVYILDRHLATTLGVPISIQDSDVTCPLQEYESASRQDVILVLHVKISRLLSLISEELFKSEKGAGRLLFDRTLSILNKLASLSQELEEVFDSRLKTSVDSPSKAMLHLTLLCHRCTILTVRPIFLVTLKCRLQAVRQKHTQQSNISTSVGTLVSAGIESAVKTVRTLVALMEHNLLDTFLPFDLEFAMAAATLLVLAQALFPATNGDTSHDDVVGTVLDEMIQRGNRVAQARKAELERLKSLCNELNQKGRGRVDVDDQLAGMMQEHAPAALPYNPQYIGVARQVSNDIRLPGAHLDNEFSSVDMFTNEGFLANFALSSQGILSVVDQIGNDYDAEYDSMWGL